ncbi:unnamed protein product [Phytomonas sp. EM1]|nr:unnamed protein product [Phytomonas sp. EM1]|eukprot:CCW59818.1 unnamed protein product [Phytomonas sp. isolate EM1]
MQNFWIKDNYLFHTPEVEFSNRCALRVTTVLGKEYLWTCSENFNEAYLYGDPMGVIPYFSIYQDARDEKGRISEITFTLSIPINNLGDILSEAGQAASSTDPSTDPVFDAVSHVEFLPEFVYRIHHPLVRLNMTAAPLLRFTRPLFHSPTGTASPLASNSGPLCGFTEADLWFHSTVRLPRSTSRKERGHHALERSPFVEDATELAVLYDLPSFARRYTSRAQRVETRMITETSGGLGLFAGGETVRGVWQDSQLLHAFTWRIRLRVQPAQLFYRPSFAEALKSAWVQYFAIAYVIQWVLWWVRGFVVVNGVVDTRAVFTRRIH